ncbi:MAG: mannose-1-phosphate guanylyltransferase [Verrucomicrobia bacterium]|nr:mannose-1-phosphate guanylyltransferase [Verrucomicrobiota bacterium]MCH8513608.1 NTP transferase domain-containing protein [Kiritimatiellia bacterium]
MSTPNPYYAVIMAGGKGERFWPLSTSRRPKQLLDLVGDKALIAQAVDRISDLIPPANVFVVTNADLVDATRQSLPELPADNIVGEPMGRDTAAAVALGCALVEEKDPNAAFCILTADQVMGDLPVFRETLADALALALEEEVLITMGIRPAHPDTGFGYINAGASHPATGNSRFFKVNKFEEKPNLERAKRFVEDGNYFWNSGMFIWSVTTLRDALEAHCAPLVCMMDAVKPHIGTDQFMDVLRKRYENLSKISIDYALMEKAKNILMAEGRFEWDDVGSWPALENHFPADDDGNTRIGFTETLDASGNIIYSRDRLTACVGVDDLIVVQAEGVTLVCPKARAQDIKRLVKILHERGDCEALL